MRRATATSVVFGGIALTLGSVLPACRRAPEEKAIRPAGHTATMETAQADGRPAGRLVTDDAMAQESFLAAYTVFMHARCMNCHPAGDAPLQGDDSIPHRQGVRRGPDGGGVYAMKCTNCHQSKNVAGEHMPPGAPVWHLPPPEMKMVFEGMSPGELCEQLKDPARNGGKTLEELLEHVSHDELVLWGWEPGDGRTLPPMNHQDFVNKVRDWIEHGAACP